MSERVEVDNASDRKQVQRAEKKAVVRRRQEIEDIREVLRTAPGRRLCWRLLEHCGVYRSTWAEGSLIHFNEGKRDIGLYILSEIGEADAHALLKMMTEVANQKAREQVEDLKTKPQEKEAAGQEESE